MWAVLLCLGVTFLILEMMMPSIFFLNFAVAAFICAGMSFLTGNILTLAAAFCAFSIILMYTLRPVLIKKQSEKNIDSGIEAKYIGKIATVVERTDSNSGTISLYDERWQAKTKNNEVLEAGSKAEIVGNESIIMLVKSAENKE